MRFLTLIHPAQLLLGVAVVVQDLAKKGRARTIESLAADAVNWARENRDLHREVVCDAEYGETEFDADYADGVITPAEAQRIRGIFSEIKREALTGKIE